MMTAERRNGPSSFRVGLAGLAVAAAIACAPVRTAEAADTFVFANTSEYDTMDPHLTFDVGRVAYRLNLYDGLMRWEDNPPKLEPWLASGYTISDDGLTYTFILREGVEFHDGSELTAHDVVYSMERILALKKGAASLFAPLVEPGSTTAPDDYTVMFKLTRPAAIFLSIVPEIHVVNADLIEKHAKDGDWGTDWLATHDAGSGSFKLRRFDPAIGFQAERFEDHFLGWGENYLDRIEFRTVREATTRVLGLIKGDFDGTDGYLPRDQVARLTEAKGVKVLEEQSMRLAVVQINTQRPPLDDVHVRRAISYAFDYDGVIDNMLGGTVERNGAPIPKNLWGYPEDAEVYSYDIDKAKVELAEAAKPVERALSIHPMVGYNQTDQMALILQNGLRKIGIDARITPETWPTLVGKTASPDTAPDIWLHWVSTYYADPHNWIGEMYDSANRGTWKASSYYRNPEVDALLEEALTLTDQDARAEKYAAAARIVVAEAPGLWIYNTKWYGPYADKVEGVRFSPVGDGQEMRWIYFKD